MRDRFSDRLKRIQRKTRGTQTYFNRLSGVSQRLGGVLSKVVKRGALAAGAGFATMAGMAMKSASTQDEAFKTIMGGTGATGEELEGLMNTYENIGSQVPQDLGTVASAVADLNTLTEASGEELEGMAKRVLDASRVLGEDATRNVDSFGRSLNQWNVPVENAEKLTEDLFQIAQDTGSEFGELTRRLSTHGAILSNVGFEVEEAAHLFGELEKGGIEVTRIMPGLNQAFRNWASEGKDVTSEFENIIERMQDAESSQEALGMATDAFGAEGAQRLTTAVRENIIDLENLGKGLDDSHKRLDEASEATLTTGERFQKMRNQISLALAPLGDEFMDIAEDAMPYLQEGIERFAGFVEDNLPLVRDVVSDVFSAMRTAFDWIIDNSDILKPALIGVATAIGAFLVPALWAKAIAMGAAVAAAAPLIGIFLAIAGVVAGLIYLWRQHGDTIKEFVLGVIDTVVGALKTFWGIIESVFTTVVGFIVGALERAWDFVVWVFTEMPFVAAEKLGYMIGTAVRFLKELPGKFREFISSAYNTAVEWISKLPGMMWDFLTKTGSRAVEFLSGLPGTFKEWFQDAFDTAVDIIKNLPDKIAGFISEIPGKVKGFIGDIWDAFSDIGSTVVDAIASGFRSALDAAGSAVSWVVDTAVGGLERIGDLGSRVATGYQKGVSGHYHGLDRVPYHGYTARLHKDEMVLPKQEAQEYRKTGGGGNTITIPKLADQIIIREEQDIEKISKGLAKELNTALEGGV